MVEATLVVEAISFSGGHYNRRILFSETPFIFVGAFLLLTLNFLEEIVRFNRNYSKCCRNIFLMNGYFWRHWFVFGKTTPFSKSQVVS